jgi:ATP-dependent DNA helicase RecG
MFAPSLACQGKRKLDFPAVIGLDELLTRVESGAPPSALETDELDFKAPRDGSTSSMKLLAEATVCFANANGGTIVVGVEDQARSRSQIIGTAIDHLDLQRYIYTNTSPRLTVDVREVERDGVRLLVIEVPRGVEVHATASGRYPARVGRDCIALNADQITNLAADRRGLDWSAEPSGRTVGEVDARAIETARDYLRRLPDNRADLVSLSDGDLCRALGVCDSEARLNRAGQLLFCRGDTEVIVYQYRATMGGDSLAVERLQPPLVSAFHRLAELIAARRNLTQLNLPNGQQIDLEDFPERAVREAAANAVVHRQLGIPDPVSVEHTPDVLIVTSPGPLVSGVTVHNILTTPSRPRNRSLAKAFRDLGLIEELGTGVTRMYREMLRSGKEPPRFEGTADRVRVTLVGGPANRNLARLFATLPSDERNDTDALLTVLYLCTHRVVLASDLAPYLQRSADEAALVLQRLAAPPANLVEPTRESARFRNPSYRLRSAVVEALGNTVVHKRRTADDIDRRIIAHVHEYGRITNQTVRNLLEVGTPRASAILRSLVDRGVLMRTTEATRGPGVEYGPGPGFAVEQPQAGATESDAEGQPRLF